MEKIPVILVALSRDALEGAISNLNFEVAQPVAVLIDGVDSNIYDCGGLVVPVYSFASIQQLIDSRSINVWLICGPIDKLWKTAKFLIRCGVLRENIVNFSLQVSFNWIGNIRYIEHNDIDYFATGISYAEVGLDLSCITGAAGVNLAGSNQDLRQGYLTAKYVFSHVKPNSIKFVLIGLAPYSFRYDNIGAFSVCTRNLQYEFTLQTAVDDSFHGKLLHLLVNNDFKRMLAHVTETEADPNFVARKNFANRQLDADALLKLDTELKNQSKPLRQDVVDRNIAILHDYIKLCKDNGAEPILFVLPVARVLRAHYDKDLLMDFRQTLQAFDCRCIDLFDLDLPYQCFYDLAHLNLKGAFLSSSMLNYHLHNEDLLPVSDYCDLPYDKLYLLRQFLGAPKFKDFYTRVLDCSLPDISKLPKIKVGIVLFDASLWCGDRLYNNFADDSRFETTVFMCMRRDKANDLTRFDFERGVKQLKRHGLNLKVIKEPTEQIEPQDVLIFLTPYLYALPDAFQLDVLTPHTLLFYIPYGFHTASANTANDMFKIHNPLLQLIYYTFRPINNIVPKFKKPPTIVFSGRPKMDIFFENYKFNFKWKLAQPDAKKIIYAPHWAIDSGLMFSTFHLNFIFFYNYAKNHPETSWVVKPHPNLYESAVSSGLFTTAEAFSDYLEMWNKLPNAKVYSGAYYQDIFATSDAMILDSNSFISEYQYTHKPLLFLTRDTQRFNKFGQSLMEVLYTADGRDFDAISEFIQSVVVNGNDIMAQARQDFFDENFNYVKINGMLASDFIHNKIAETIFNPTDFSQI